MPPWYDKLERIVAPSEPIANMALAILIGVSILVLVKGSPVVKAGWLAYLVSP